MVRTVLSGFLAATLVTLCPAVKLQASPDSGFLDHPDDLLNELWAGRDISQNTAEQLFLGDSSFRLEADKAKSARPTNPQEARAAKWHQHHAAHSASPVQKIVLMGPMDSGTHLMSWLLSHNYRGHMDEACGMTFEGCRYLWKHSLDIDGVYRVLNQTIGKDLSDTVVIAMVRTPIAQIVGWKKDPWDLAECVDKPWQEMVNKCHARLAASRPGEHAGIAAQLAPMMDFPHTMGVYNRYIQLYHKLKDQNRFKEVIIVPYEDVVLTPKSVLHNLAQKLGWAASWDVDVPEGSEKGAQGLSRQAAVDKIVARDFMKEAHASLPILCPHLDTLAKNITEGSWIANNPDIPASAVHPYTYDCRDYLS